VLGKRINEHRNSFTLPQGITFPNIESKTNAASVEAIDDGINYGGKFQTGLKLYQADGGTDTTPDWETVIPWLRTNTRLPIWIKGGTTTFLVSQPPS
jgi:(S)-2-hydroxy-acid oxidase